MLEVVGTRDDGANVNFINALRFAPRAAEIAAASLLTYRPIKRGELADLDKPVVVSMTSYPPRFKTLARTLRNLRNQSVRPQAFVLWIANDDVAKLPQSVLRLKEFGLQIRTCPDYRSLKKLLPALQAFPNAYIVTADDDLYYPRDWLRGLIDAAAPGTKDIVARIVTRPAFKHGQLAPVLDWDLRYDAPDASEPGAFNFLTGAGALFPPGSLDPRVEDFECFNEICSSCDDTWVSWMAHLRGTRVRRVPGKRMRLVAWEGTYGTSLSDANFASGAAAQNRMIKNMVQAFGIPTAIDALRPSSII